ncbi:hypothetical protein PG985_001574 [Apiospora marii]|uniref:Uncharacterized protein n=1 Tax=Apiospora marii TaxID=335849 RepID=A0ABR1RJL2_9PEZI
MNSLEVGRPLDRFQMIQQRRPFDPVPQPVDVELGSAFGDGLESLREAVHQRVDGAVVQRLVGTGFACGQKDEDVVE